MLAGIGRHVQTDWESCIMEKDDDLKRFLTKLLAISAKLHVTFWFLSSQLQPIYESKLRT